MVFYPSLSLLGVKGGGGGGHICSFTNTHADLLFYTMRWSEVHSGRFKMIFSKKYVPTLFPGMASL